MALKGNLSDFSFVQLLNLINLAKKTGALTIESGNWNVKLFFRNGKLSSAFLGRESVPIVRIMARARLLSGSQAASLAEKYKNLGDKEAGISLMNSGHLTQGQIFSGIEFYLKEIVRTLFTWHEGAFDFWISELPPKEVIQVDLGLESLILEGSRQIRELEDLTSEIPSLDMSLRFTERSSVDFHQLNLNGAEWRVVSFINPNSTMRQIAAAARLNEIEIRRIVYNLLQAGLVEIVRPAEPILFKGAHISPLVDTPEQRSIIHRVINRIKSL